MIRPRTLFWTILVLATGFAMFSVKYQVQTLEDSYARSEKAIADTRREIRLLEADWAYLNRPDTLSQLNQRYLSLVPMGTKELRLSVADIAMRPEPPPADDSAPALAVAAAAPAPAAGTVAAPTAAAPPAAPAAQKPVSIAAAQAEPGGEPAKPVAVAAVLRTAAVHRPRSLDQLFTEIAARR
jgi:hypothetical protein